MDIRLKNNKQALRTAAAIIALAALCYVFVAVRYKDTADTVFREYDSGFEDESFVRMLFQSNYVLYPEVLEKSGKSFRTDDLYLSFHEEAASEAVYYGNEQETERSSERLRADGALSVQQSLERINELYTTEISRRMDYCVIDEETQTILKNTTRSPELLIEDEISEYAYYFIVRYDKNGAISDIRVRGNDTEMFLKNAQLVANNTDSLLFTNSQKSESYAMTDESGNVVGRMTITQKNPENATFIYAMTSGQIENFSWIGAYESDTSGNLYLAHYIGGYDKELIYEKIGAGRIYQLIILAITCVFFVMARYMPQRTADTAGTRLCMEVILLFQWVLLTVFYSIVVHTVYYINEVSGGFRLPVRVKFVAGYGVLFIGMFVLFGVWYWCLLSICGIFRDFRSFISQRSYLYRKWGQIKEFFRKLRDRWQKEVSDVDLGKNNKKLLKRLAITQFIILSFICCCWFFGIFILIFYSVFKYAILKHYIGKTQKQYNNLMQAANAIAQGKFDNDFKENFGIFESYKNELYQIQDGFGKAVEEEVKSQRMKTELITNVSHDLKTPLTAIITYIDLLKDENITQEQRLSYLDTLERKSLRLKVLIEDLFEISKASSGSVKLEPVAVDICSLMRQVYLEHEERMNEIGLEVRFDMPEEKIILQLDSQKTYRIFENLYVNIIKYAMPNTRVYIQVKKSENIHIEIKNISAQELTVNPMDLTERFVRGDVSRNTEGSGLGLAIAKSFTQLQGGTFEIGIDGDLFKAVIEWN